MGIAGAGSVLLRLSCRGPVGIVEADSGLPPTLLDVIQADGDHAPGQPLGPLDVLGGSRPQPGSDEAVELDGRRLDPLALGVHNHLVGAVQVAEPDEPLQPLPDEEEVAHRDGQLRPPADVDAAGEHHVDEDLQGILDPVGRQEDGNHLVVVLDLDVLAEVVPHAAVRVPGPVDRGLPGGLRPDDGEENARVDRMRGSEERVGRLPRPLRVSVQGAHADAQLPVGLEGLGLRSERDDRLLPGLDGLVLPALDEHGLDGEELLRVPENDAGGLHVLGQVVDVPHAVGVLDPLALPREDPPQELPHLPGHLLPGRRQHAARGRIVFPALGHVLGLGGATHDQGVAGQEAVQIGDVSLAGPAEARYAQQAVPLGLGSRLALVLQPERLLELLPELLGLVRLALLLHALQHPHRVDHLFFEVVDGVGDLGVQAAAHLAELVVVAQAPELPGGFLVEELDIERLCGRRGSGAVELLEEPFHFCRTGRRVLRFSGGFRGRGGTAIAACFLGERPRGVCSTRRRLCLLVRHALVVLGELSLEIGGTRRRLRLRGSRGRRLGIPGSA